MASWLFLTVLFVAKVFDNALGTAKQIFIQKNKCLLAGISLAMSNYIYLAITKNIVNADGQLALIIVSIAAGVGCCVAMAFDNQFSKDRTYINVIMSDDIEAMKEFRDFLASHKITNVASESYTLDWEKKTLTITAYAETKAQSRLIDKYVSQSETKFKRMVQGEKKK